MTASLTLFDGAYDLGYSYSRFDGDEPIMYVAPKGSHSFITGHFGFIGEKKSGQVGQYDMAGNMSEIEGKTYRASMLED